MKKLLFAMAMLGISYGLFAQSWTGTGSDPYRAEDAQNFAWNMLFRQIDISVYTRTAFSSIVEGRNTQMNFDPDNGYKATITSNVLVFGAEEKRLTKTKNNEPMRYVVTYNTPKKPDGYKAGLANVGKEIDKLLGEAKMASSLDELDDILTEASLILQDYRKVRNMAILHGFDDRKFETLALQQMEIDEEIKANSAALDTPERLGKKLFAMIAAEAKNNTAAVFIDPCVDNTGNADNPLNKKLSEFLNTAADKENARLSNGRTSARWFFQSSYLPILAADGSVKYWRLFCSLQSNYGTNRGTTIVSETFTVLPSLIQSL